MTSRIVEPHCGLPSLSGEQDRAWRTWLMRHGLPEAERICAGGPIVCDDDERTVSTWVWVLDDDGHRIAVGDTEVMREWVTVQLEAPALPLPSGYRIKVEL
jgi:hypothetical protein